jgi:hypothetical protein
MPKSISLTMMLIMALVLPLLLPLSTGQAISIDEDISSPGDIGWQGGFSINGLDGSVTAIAVDGSRVYIGGIFSAAGNVGTNDIILWDGTTWTPLGDGLNGMVRALTVDGRGNLYAGGDFTQAGQTRVNYIARWDGQTWHPLGSGMDWVVSAIAIDGAGRVFAGGYFNYAGGVRVNKIAMWDAASWKDVGGGVTVDPPHTGDIDALVFDRFGLLYAGGYFTRAGGVPVNNVARWDGSTWSSLGDGIWSGHSWDTVNALAADNRGNVFAGGNFTMAGGINAVNIARWNGDTWSPVGGGIQSSRNSTSWVSSMLVDGQNIYTGGEFDLAGSTPVKSIARWNGDSWDTLQGGAWRDNNPPDVRSLAINRDGMIYAAGYFNMAGGKCARSIAVWDGADWSGLGKSTSTDGAITTMIPDQQGGYYVAGEFDCAGGQVANHIAHWDGVSWSTMGNGLGSNFEWATPRAMIMDHAGNVYVGGMYDNGDGSSVNSLAKWNGTDWEKVGSGLNGYVLGLAVDSQDRLYAAENFFSIYHNPPQYGRIMRWNGGQWEQISGVIESSVTALAIDAQDRVVIGGNFKYVEGVTAPGLARWDGQQWEAICDGIVSIPHVLLIDGDTIYIGSTGVQKIEHGTLETVGGKFGNPGGEMLAVYALILDQRGRLFAGGEFTQVGQISVKNIAMWNGRAWHGLGSGVNWVNVHNMPIVYHLSFENSGKLLVAGLFGQAGGKVTRNLAFWTEPSFAWFPLISR